MRTCADGRDANGQMSLFTADTHFVAYMNAKDSKPSQVLHQHDALAAVNQLPLTGFFGERHCISAVAFMLAECADLAGLSVV